jgi:hypothetical protein
MTRSILLAALLGVVLGVALGYSPNVQPASAPRTQMLFMQQAGTFQPNAGPAAAHPSDVPTQLLLAFLVAVLIATPLFLLAKRKVA